MIRIIRTTAIFVSMLCLGIGCSAEETGNKSDMDSGKELIVVAHRGGAALGPENTLECIRRGMAVGARWIEIDVHLSADGEIVVCHDPSVDRTTNGRGYISESGYQALRALRIKDKDGNLTGEHLPTLDEVLDLTKGRAKLLLEIKYTKHSLPGIEQACIDCIRRHGAEADVVIQSFDDDVLFTVNSLAPEIRLEKLLFFASTGMGFGFDGSFSGFDFEKYSFVDSFNVYYLAATRSFVQQAHSHGKEVKVWTLDKRDSKLEGMVDGVITNDPRLFIKGKRTWNI